MARSAAFSAASPDAREVRTKVDESGPSRLDATEKPPPSALAAPRCGYDAATGRFRPRAYAHGQVDAAAAPITAGCAVARISRWALPQGQRRGRNDRTAFVSKGLLDTGFVPTAIGLPRRRSERRDRDRGPIARRTRRGESSVPLHAIVATDALSRTSLGLRRHHFSGTPLRWRFHGGGRDG